MKPTAYRAIEVDEQSPAGETWDRICKQFGWGQTFVAGLMTSLPAWLRCPMWRWTPRQGLSFGTTMIGIAVVLDGLEVFGRPFNWGAIIVGAVLIVVGGSLMWRWRH